MEQRVSVLTLGVGDLAVARRFYVEGLGWSPAMEVDGEVVFFNIAPGLVLGLYADLAADAGVPGRGVGLTSISQNMRERDEVDAVIAQAEAAGGVVTKPAVDTEWGGRSGYFADPDGHLWEIAWNPHWAIDDAGHIAVSK